VRIAAVGKGAALRKAPALRKALVAVVLLGIAGFAGYFVLTAPATWVALHPSRRTADAGPADLANGHALFYAGSCGTCHATPGQANEKLLGGGLALVSGFGTFHMPNISPDTTNGIGGWSTAQFTRAMRDGTSDDGQNEYPAFPYTSFQRMDANDLRDLFAYLKTLPKVAAKAPGNDLKFPFTMRRGVGLWKLVFLDGKVLPPAPGRSAAWLRGRYLVEGPGHCAECHSPRNVAGAVIASKRFAGAPDAVGGGYVPNITQDATGIGYWSVREIADYLGTGVTPIGTQSGGSMMPIIGNMAHLSPADRAAMADYVKTIPGIDAPNAGAPEPNRTATIRLLPPSTRKVASPTAALAVAADTLAATGTLYTVATEPFFLEKGAAAPAGAGDGRLLPAGKLTVLAHEGDWLQVRIDGWQQAGSPAAMYALQKQRILVAALSPAAVAKVTHKPGIVDPATKLTWIPSSLTVWIGTAGLNPDIGKVWTYSSQLYGDSCATCHALQPAGGFLANQWIGNLAAMKRFAALDDGQYRLLQAYLQFHSKDVGKTGGME
jgi:mono/diheme cytochrome c family protein